MVCVSYIIMYFSAVAGMQYTLHHDMREHPYGLRLGRIANEQVWVESGGPNFNILINGFPYPKRLVFSEIPMLHSNSTTPTRIPTLPNSLTRESLAVMRGQARL